MIIAALSALYGAAAYVLFLATLVYSIGFLGNLPLPQTIDAGPSGPPALAADAMLIAILAVQHGLMARTCFRRWWTSVAPPLAERPTIVILATLPVVALLLLWRPATDLVWQVGQPLAVLLLNTLFWLGWGIVLVCILLLDHAKLFGFSLVWARLRGATPAVDWEPILDRSVRHPIALGLLMALWAAPVMTWGHLLLALGITSPLAAGLALERRGQSTLSARQAR